MQTLKLGVYPVLPTPFTDEGDVDEMSFRRVLDYALDAGATGVVFPGVASEYAQLSSAERLRLTTIVGEVTRDRAPFIVGASAATAEEAIRFAQGGADAGARAAMIMTPAGPMWTLAELIDFYNALSASSSIPLILQNAPAPTGVGLSVDEVVTLVRAAPGIRYVKEEMPPYGQRIETILGMAGSALAGVFGGAGGRYVIDELNRGSIGTMPAAELIEIHVALVRAHEERRLDEARALFRQILPILSMQTIYRWSLTKEILKRRGLVDSTHVRAPGPELDAQDRAELTALLHQIEHLTGRLAHPSAGFTKAG